MNGNKGKRIFKILQQLKKRNIVKKIGYSIYCTSELDKFYFKFKPDIVQGPLNILDQRIIHSGWLKKLNKSGIEFHARSIFLQGKILKRNKFHSPLVNKKVNDFHSWCSENKVTKIGACINFIRNYKFINKIIVGIDNKSQLKTIIKEMRKKKYFVPNKFKMNKFNLIDPRKKK